MPKITKNQSKAINSDGKNVLVSASAGSGKTFVMIERIIRLITEEGVDVSSILAVTYTNLAASEMKQKLVKAVLKRIGEGKDVERMRKTLAEIPTADVSTFHSFCLNLLRTYFYSAEVDPDFSIADTSKDKELTLSAMNAVFNKLYEEKDEDFLKLVRIYRRYRGDNSLKEELLNLYQKSVSESDPKGFLQKCVLAVNEENYCQYEEFLLEVLKKKTLGKASGYQKLKEKIELYADEKDGITLLSSLEDAMVKVNTVATAKDLKDLVFKTTVATKSTGRTSRKDEEFIAVKNELSEFKKKLTEFYATIRDAVPENRDEDLKKYLQTREIISSLVKVIDLFEEKYSQLKAKDGVLNFADLEHKTLKLLRSDPAVLDAVKSKYKYIFADEYQDVNGVQEEILNIIANGNLFMVGDVKQSIYAFRGCNPEIFSSKYEQYEKTGDGEPISLESNFRSTDEVLSAVNSVFERVMTKERGGVDYSSNKMVGGGAYKTGDGSATLHIIEVEKPDKRLIDGLYNLYQDATSEEQDEDFYEGSLVAKIIEEELQKDFYDVSIGKYRKVEPSDIAVLTRNSSGFTDDMVKWLIREGIPVANESKADILQYPEIKLLISVLKLIDFYADDPPLATVLKSSIGKLDEEDLAEIRREGLIGANPKNKPSFLKCVEKYKKVGTNKVLKQKLLDFEEYFNKLRVYAEFSDAGEILSKVLRETGLDLEIASRSLGKIRMGRVERLIAETKVSGKSLSVGEFLQRIENAGESVSVSEAAGSDAVKVVSMHSSKGLEYPIVILAGLFKKFNAQDDTKQILFSRKHGIATYHYDEENKIRSSTLARTFFKQTASIERANEEARVFYVAMTRAKARLHLVTTKEVKDERSEYAYLFTNSFTDFLTKFDMPTVSYKSSQLVKDKTLELKKVEIGNARESLKKKIVEKLTFDYPFKEDLFLPVKSSATEVNSRNNEKLRAEKQGEKFKKPHLISEENSDKKAVGTSYHHFLEVCDLTQKDVDNQLIALHSQEKLTEEEIKLLDRELLGKILSHSLWDRLKGYKLYKEQPFLSTFTANELYGVDSLAEILIQGIIDLMAVKENEVILVDYKTSDHDATRLKKEYKTQLLLYKKAIEKGLKLTVKEVYILSLKTGELISVFD